MTGTRTLKKGVTWDLGYGLFLCDADIFGLIKNSVFFFDCLLLVEGGSWGYNISSRLFLY
jgi:hypothetical protein